MKHIPLILKLYCVLLCIVGTVGFMLAPNLAAASGFNYTMPINSFEMSGIKSWFDHTSPQYGSDASTTMTLYNGSATSVNVDLSNCTPSTHCYNGHNGIDYGTYMATGMRVLAAASGVVKKAGWDNVNHSLGYGIVIRLWHSQYQQSTIYGHLDSTSVGVVLPDKVTRGQVMALSGKTGSAQSGGAHLHFSVFNNNSLATNNSIDPYGWIGSGSDPWTIDQGRLWANDTATLYNVVSGDITSATTWGGIYVVDGTAIVDSGVRLTIVPDTIIKFKTKQSKLEIAGGGVLDAEGTASAGIYFTSYHDDSVGGDTDATSIPATDTPNFGDWDRIKLDSGASSTIVHAFIRYGASTGQGTPIMLYNTGNLTLLNTDVATGVNFSAFGVYNSSATTTITSCNIYGYDYGVELEGGVVNVASSNIHNNTNGINQSSGALSVTSSDIYANTSDGIVLADNTATISGNAIQGNGFGLAYGVSPTTTATFNYWGAASGPFNAKYNSGGTGNAVDDFVNFIPFLTHWP
jgi:Peptidase family M23